MKAPAAIACFLALTSAAPPPVEGVPPPIYWGEGATITIYANDVTQFCPMEASPGHVLLGCYFLSSEGVPITVVPNPCLFDMNREQFARIACHEKAHSNGWRHN